MVSTKCSKNCQIYLLSKLSAVKTVKDIYGLTLSAAKSVKILSKIFIVSTKCSKNCQRYLLSTPSGVKTVKDIY